MRLALVVRRYAPWLAVASACCLVLAHSLLDPTTRYLASYLLPNAGLGALVLIAVAFASPAGWLARIGVQFYSVYLCLTAAVSQPASSARSVAT